jgi:hypothetical protein
MRGRRLKPAGAPARGGDVVPDVGRAFGAGKGVAGVIGVSPTEPRG